MRWSAQAFSWFATLVAAHRLTPGDYGIVAMATVGIGMLRLVEDFGLDSILVQDRSIVGLQQARLAGLILTVGASCCLVFLVLAQPIAAFFSEPRVALVVAAMSVLFVTDALQVVPRALLQRELAFRRLALALFVQVFVTQTVLLVAVRAGWGVWSLVVNSVAGAIAVTALLIVWRPYPVRWPREFATLARPVLQGWRVVVSRMAWYAYNTLDQTIIGRVLGKDALGAYSFATTFASLSMQEVGSVVNKVVPAVFSQTQHRRAQLRRYFLALTELVSYLTLPLSIGLALTADLFIRLALGPQWNAVIVPLQLLCLYAAFYSTQLLVSHVIMWTGQFRLNMWFTILTAVVLPIGFLVGVKHGLAGVALCWAVLYPLTNVPPLVICCRTISMSIRQWLESLRPASSASLVMAAAVLAVRAALPLDVRLPVAFITSVGIGVLAYCVVLWFGFRARIWRIVADLLARAPVPAQQHQAQPDEQ
jgi:teichuronic acid exporter